jgi:hypothetical protein
VNPEAEGGIGDGTAVPDRILAVRITAATLKKR